VEHSGLQVPRLLFGAQGTGFAQTRQARTLRRLTRALDWDRSRPLHSGLQVLLFAFIPGGIAFPQMTQMRALRARGCELLRGLRLGLDTRTGDFAGVPTAVPCRDVCAEDCLYERAEVRPFLELGSQDFTAGIGELVDACPSALLNKPGPSHQALGLQTMQGRVDHTVLEEELAAAELLYELDYCVAVSRACPQDSKHQEVDGRPEGVSHVP
jgi:hypothetical protein